MPSVYMAIVWRLIAFGVVSTVALRVESVEAFSAAPSLHIVAIGSLH